MGDWSVYFKSFYTSLLERLSFLKDKSVRWIVILMTGALLGLITFQFYWANHLISGNLEQFDRSVYEVIKNINAKIDQVETIYYIHKIRKESQSLKGSVVNDPLNVDSQNELSMMHRPVLGDGFSQVHRIEFERKDQVNRYGLVSKQGMVGSDANYFVANLNFDLSFGFENNGTGDGMQEVGVESFDLRSELISDAVRFVLSNQKDITERVDSLVFDSLLRAEIKSFGLETSYYYGLKCKNCEQKDQFRFVSDPSKIDELPSAEYKLLLSSGQIIDSQYELFLEFPSKNKYLFSKIFLALSSSGILILVIIICFVYAISTIIRQKKLSLIKNDFINNMTHEFKTPISTISLACQVLQDPDARQMSNVMERYLRIIESENKRLGTQVEKVLQIATLDKGKFKLKIAPLDVHKIIEKAVDNIAIQLESRQGEIVLDLQAHQSLIDADQVHLNNLIYNLLDNANKYSSDRPQIKIHTYDDQNGIYIQVSDKGIGIQKDALNKIFEKFYRVPTGNIHNVKGFGLGLSYAKTMALAHHGDLTVKSELGKGSTFTLFLPFKHEQN